MVDLKDVAAKLGMEIVPVGEMERRVRALGYELDRDLDCRAVSRVLTGPHAGLSYPCITTGLREADTKRSAFHYQARRDGRFKDLQALRGTIAAISRGALLEI